MAPNTNLNPPAWFPFPGRQRPRRKRPSLYWLLAIFVFNLWMVLLIRETADFQPAPDMLPPTEVAAVTPAVGDIDRGEQLYKDMGCIACHGMQSEADKIGPALNGILGQSREFTDGTSATVDRAYIRNSIINPQSQIRTGYGANMPNYESMLTPEDVDALTAFISDLN